MRSPLLLLRLTNALVTLITAVLLTSIKVTSVATNEFDLFLEEPHEIRAPFDNLSVNSTGALRASPESIPTIHERYPDHSLKFNESAISNIFSDLGLKIYYNFSDLRKKANSIYFFGLDQKGCSAIGARTDPPCQKAMIQQVVAPDKLLRHQLKEMLQKDLVPRIQAFAKLRNFESICEKSKSVSELQQNSERTYEYRLAMLELDDHFMGGPSAGKVTFAQRRAVTGDYVSVALAEIVCQQMSKILKKPCAQIACTAYEQVPGIDLVETRRAHWLINGPHDTPIPSHFNITPLPLHFNITPHSNLLRESRDSVLFSIEDSSALFFTAPELYKHKQFLTSLELIYETWLLLNLPQDLFTELHEVAFNRRAIEADELRANNCLKERFAPKPNTDMEPSCLKVLTDQGAKRFNTTLKDISSVLERRLRRPYRNFSFLRAARFNLFVRPNDTPEINAYFEGQHYLTRQIISLALSFARAFPAGVILKGDGTTQTFAEMLQQQAKLAKGMLSLFLTLGNNAVEL